jgi:hypothetical protein
MIADLINAAFEMGAGVAQIINCYQLYKDKQIKGVRVSVTAFFGAWGLWNLYYYPSLGQWASFSAGILICLANFVWVGLAIYYSKNKPLTPEQIAKLLRGNDG